MPAQLSKIWTTSAPASICPRSETTEASTSRSISTWNSSGCRRRHQPRRRLVRGAAAGHHVGRNRPRRPAEADQRLVGSQRAAHPPHRLEDRRKPLGQPVRVESRDPLGIDRIEPRPFAFDKAQPASEGIGNDQDVGKEDRRIEVEAPDRLQRDFGRRSGSRQRSRKEPAVCAQGPVFGKIASRLPHQPDRRRIDQPCRRAPGASAV